ncbi:hypothetical protein QBC46DRAFT_276290 [Diplogelasinospora grovesii]|uniref:Chorismate synthase protein n=1 Tax=Diplogelasinospora grovesii TaxID=303347 RepID=A0AAN6SAD9_9PEZI|nr:hypothetical protein QBC46DRAFT_276290 [Diplogelasinospora grovesii]
MAIPWGTVKSLLIFFAPILLPKLFRWYSSVKNAPKMQGMQIRPVPSGVRRALFLLFAVSAVLLLRISLPIFSPENIFQVADARLQIPVDVLFNRLSKLRPNGTLTPQDHALRTKFVSLESRLLYLQFGPSVLADCPFCTSDDPKSYLWYALPDLLAPHLVNLIAIALSTSQLFTSSKSDKGDANVTRWRTPATLAAIILAGLDIYMVSTYNYQLNSRATRLPDLDFFFWTARTYRSLLLAGLDLLLAFLLWLSSTNRAFLNPPSPAERVESVTRTLMAAKSKLNAAGVVKNAASRDDELLRRTTSYWAHEVRLMQDVMEEREVIEGVNDALQNRIDIQNITRDAEAYAKGVVQGVTYSKA